jgi:hypothetical protein
MPALETRPLIPSVLVTLAASLALACGPGASQVSSSSGANLGLVIQAEGDRKNFHDFGAIPHGTRETHTFVLENTDSVPVTILSTQGACSCVRIKGISYTTEAGDVHEGDVRATDSILVVPPGELVDITILADTTAVGTPNKDKLSIVRVRTDSKTTPFLTFEVHLVSQKLFQVTPAAVHMNEVPTTSGNAAVVRIITGTPNSPARIVGIAEQGKRCTAELQETLVGAETLWTLTVTLPELQPLGPVRDRVVLTTTDEAGQGKSGTLEIEVWAQVVDDVVVYPRSANFQVIESGTDAALELELHALVPGMRVKIETVAIESALADHFQITHEAVAPDANGRSAIWKLALSADAGLPPGRFTGSFRLQLDDDQNPEVRHTFSGIVREAP